MQSALQAVQAVYAAMASGHLPGMLTAIDERMAWNEPASLPYTSQVGPNAIAEKIFTKAFEDVEGLTITPTEFIDGGDTIVALGRYGGRGSRTAIALDTRFVHIWRLRDGKLVYFRTYTDTRRWLDALGV